MELVAPSAKGGKKKKFYSQEDLSIHGWIKKHNIRNEKGDPIDFENHLYLWDIYADNSQNLCVMKAAQVGMSTAEIVKNHYDAKRYKMDIIYTLPTDNDVRVFVGGKVNRIIANNPVMLRDVADKDSVESKQVGKSMIYFRGTFTKKAAIMVTADRLSHDEKDSSKLDVVADYQARLQHSKHKQTHTFSHPSLPETGVHADWLASDQKHWWIKCPHCQFWQFLSWDIFNPKKMSVDIERGEYVCKRCRGVLSDDDRAIGQWVPKYPGRAISGYWVPLLIAPWVSAKEIIAKFKHPDTTQEFFYTKILGLPYADGKSKLLRKHFFQNLTGQQWAPQQNERIVLGIDVGARVDYVLGNKNGLFYHGDSEDYEALDEIMQRWPRCIAVIDGGGDLIRSRAFFARWPGRVFLCFLTGDRTTKELVKEGKKDEHGTMNADRNRMIQLVVDEFRDRRIPVHGTEADWYEYWTDWNNLSKIKVLDPTTNQTKGYKWVRSGRDHRALATVFWRVGMMRFGGTGLIVGADEARKPNSYVVDPNQTVTAGAVPDFKEMFDKMEQEEEHDWRA